MIIARHYEDEALIQLMEEDRHGADEHLPTCTECSEKVESFRLIAETLHESDVWDTGELPAQPVPSTIANLRAFADRMSHEDSQAAVILQELLAGPREEWMPRLEQHPEWRTAGVVRKLVEAFISVITSMPPDGLEITALSTEIADHLDATAFSSDTVARLRGSAWRDRAYALFYVCQYPESIAAAARADLNFQACVVDEYDRARVSVVKVLSLHAMESFSIATGEARLSGDTFTRFGDMTRLASARMAESHLLFARSEFDGARRLLEDLETQVRGTADANTHARVLSNLGYCLWQLGRTDEALNRYNIAATLLDDLEIRTEAARLRWNVASLLASAGRVDEARVRFDGLKRVFDEMHMTSEAALVSLDIADILLARGQFAEVEEICRSAMRSFELSGVGYSTRALTALAYIREAARHKTATTAQVKHVREYIRRLPQEAELLFAPLPEPPPLNLG